MSDSVIQAISTIMAALITAGAAIFIEYRKNPEKYKFQKPKILIPEGTKVKRSFNVFGYNPAIIALVIAGGIFGYVVSDIWISERTVDLDTLFPQITKGAGSIEKVIPWWTAYHTSGDNGVYNPASPPGRTGCFGVAWNVIGFNGEVIVFQHERNLEFGSGGWYVQICADNSVKVSAEQIGKIQAYWLAKEYGINLDVEVLP